MVLSVMSSVLRETIPPPKFPVEWLSVMVLPVMVSVPSLKIAPPGLVLELPLKVLSSTVSEFPGVTSAPAPALGVLPSAMVR